MRRNALDHFQEAPIQATLSTTAFIASFFFPELILFEAVEFFVLWYTACSLPL